MATLLNNSTQKALTTLARAKAFIDIGSDSKDTILTMLINQATGFIERYTKRSLLSQTYTNEIYDGTGTREIVLLQFPVTAITSLQVNAGTIGSPDWQTVGSDRYGYYSDGRVTLASAFQAFLATDAGTFIDGPQRYRVTYTAGYLIDFDNENDPTKHTLPQELEYACLQLMSGFMNTRKSQGMSAAKVGDVSMSFKGVVAVDPEVKGILEKYATAAI